MIDQRESDSTAGPQADRTGAGYMFKAAIIIILAVSAGVYINALSNEFVYDDQIQIVENRWIKDIRFIPEIFSSNPWGFDPDTALSNYYRPMLHMIFMVNYHLFGPAPWGFHLTNILFHAAISVMVFVITRRLLEKFRPFESPSLWPAFGASLLFATHPIHTEAVAWINGLVDLSYTFFLLLSFYLYLRAEEGIKGSYLLSVISFGLAALCKEPALALPLILVAYDYLLGKETHRYPGRLKRYIPYFAVAAVYLLVRLSVLGGFSPKEPGIKLSSFEYMINIFPLFMQYLQKLILPVDLNAFHVFRPVHSLFDAGVMLSLAVTAGLVLFAFICLKKNRLLLFSLLLIALPLLPALYIKAINFECVFAERYLYLPSFGFVLLAAAALSWAKGVRQGLVPVLAVIILALTAVYSAATINRNAVWKDSLTLYTDALKKSPDSAMVHSFLGFAYANQGRTQEAIYEYLTALGIKPDIAKTHLNLGVVYANQKQFQKAINEYLTALMINPRYANARYNLGLAYANQERLREAVIEFKAALNINPNDVDTLIYLGVIYTKQKQLQDAITVYLTALKINPDALNAHNNLGIVYAEQGRIQEAINEFKTALGLKPDYVDAHNNLGIAYARLNRLEEAVSEFQTVLKLNPFDPQAHNNLGLIYFQQGRLDEAIHEFRTSLEINPDNVNARENLDIAYRKKTDTLK